MRADHDPSQPADDDLVAVPRAQLDALVARVEVLERAAAHGGAAPPDAAEVPVDRRRAILGLAGAAVAGAATLAGPARPAAAANGNPIRIGEGNVGTSPTTLRVNGVAGSPGLAVGDNEVPTDGGGAAVQGHAKSQNFNTAVQAVAKGFAYGMRSTSENGAALGASSETGSGIVVSAGGLLINDAAVNAIHTNPTFGVGVSVAAPTHLYLRPIGVPDPPTSGRPSELGHIRLSGAFNTGATLWACVGAGTPGTWRKIVGTGTAGAFHLLPTPVRVYDSRAGTSPAQGPKTPLAPGTARTIDLTHNSSGVPAGATGVLLTVLLVGAANANGNMTVWANDKAKPQSNTMVWGGATGRFTATAVTAVDAQARVKVDASHRTDLVLDVVGYYR